VGIETNLGVQYLGTTVVITTGTFLRGLMHIGPAQQSGGRAGETAALSLSDSLKEVGLELGRLKTGTPPRLLRRSIDFARTQIQPGDEPVPYFSYWKDDMFHVEHSDPTPAEGNRPDGKYPPGSILSRLNGQMACHITYTTKATAEMVRANLHKSPMYSGAIEGIGPRYCPSIEDKIVKFAEKDRHQIFLEPEGIATDEIYVNGFSTCLPFEVQVDLVKTIVGCENAEIMRPAYAVEYDFAFPTQLDSSLETKVCRNLFLGGQINGTSGYEEAGAQGLMAGINAARRVQGLEPVVLRRDQAYIGVLIDDLITKGTTEPYRMFTSRAEYRLMLRQDNADLRLSETGHRIGLLPIRNYQKVIEKRQAIGRELERLERTRDGTLSLAQMLRRLLRYNDLPIKNASLSEDVIQQIEILFKYAGYINRQEAEAEKLRGMEEKRIPDWIDYNSIPSLRTEARQKLNTIRPMTLGQASRISGVTPADVSLVMVWMKRGAKEELA
ncbi:MAG: tRNA uridine-5-carboxymethylaminomethyl(34) synthesis enzyme MnmG, partial [Verrucomicrobia bacterium]